MKNVRITVIRMACYKDLMEEYENPIEHTCDMWEGRVFICETWKWRIAFCVLFCRIYVTGLFLIC